MSFQKSLRMIFALFGTSLCMVALILAIITILFLGRAESATGRVIDFERVEGAAPFLAAAPGEGILYYPIIRFEDSRRLSTDFTALRGRYRRGYRLNEAVAVRYIPTDPRRAMIDNPWSIWGRSLIFGALGALFIGIGLLVPYGFRT